MKSNTKNRCQDKALLRLEMSNEAEQDTINTDVISTDMKDYVIRDKDSELQSHKKETSFDGEKVMSDEKPSTELPSLPDVVDCKGIYWPTLFFCFLMGQLKFDE